LSAPPRQGFFRLIASPAIASTSLIALSDLYCQVNRLDESRGAYRNAMAVDPEAVQRIVSSTNPVPDGQRR
jgi:hypothetical protein